MARQISPGIGPPSVPVLEERILQLETKVALLTRVVQNLAREIADQPEE